jgi:hypothetical protein
MKITRESRDLVLFMSLGDGTINQNGYLSMRHCVAQKEYLEWKSRILIKNGINTTGLYPVSNNGYGAFEVRTYSHDFCKIYRNILYRPSKTIANITILKKLTPLGLAIWYMDDGGLSQKRHKITKEPIANELFINTHLRKEENQVIIDYFNQYWSIKFSQCKNRGKYRLRCGTKEARKFIDIIYPYIKDLKCMVHKINLVNLKRQTIESMAGR